VKAKMVGSYIYLEVEKGLNDFFIEHPGINIEHIDYKCIYQSDSKSTLHFVLLLYSEETEKVESENQ